MHGSNLIDQEDLYKTIFQRKSVRKFQVEPLPDSVLALLREFIKDLLPLYGEIETSFMFLSPDDIRSFLPQPQAPHYIAAFSQKREGYRTNIGFMLQQLDLFLSAQGIGSCWLGIPKPKKEIIESNPLEYIILLAFGSPKEKLHRSSVSEFKRKSLSEISDMESDAQILEPARLAPSSVNNQPWFFSGDRKNINVYCKAPNFLKNLLLKKWIPIDMGIAIYHLCLHFKIKGQEVKIIQDPNPSREKPGYVYFNTLKIV